MGRITREEYIKQRLLFPKNTAIEFYNNPGEGWGGNYHFFTQLIFGEGIIAIEKERVKTSINEYEKLLEELPILILQSFAILKKSTKKIKQPDSGMSFGNLSFTSNNKIRLTPEQKKLLIRGALNSKEKEILEQVLNKFKSKTDACGLLVNKDGVALSGKEKTKFYPTRRIVSDLAYRVASYRAIRKIINDTHIMSKNCNFAHIRNATCPVSTNIKERIRYLIKENKAVIKNPTYPTWTKQASANEIEELKKIIRLPRGNPQDIILHHFFPIISGYLKDTEGFSKRQIAFLLAKLQIVDICGSCTYNTPLHCPKIFISPPSEKLPCERQYRVLNRF